MKEPRRADPGATVTLRRRRFLAAAGTATAGVTIMSSKLAFGSQANSKIKLGMIGCGSRGTRVAGWFQKNGNFEVWAGADYFQAPLDAWGERYGVDPARRFTGLSCYKKMLESGVDAVAIESPPYFHPEQAAAAVAAGAHVYLAKPIAVDVPGCQLVRESGREATRKNLCFLVDFQTRADPFFQEALRRVRAGALGEFAFGEATYHAGSPWARQEKFLEADPSDPENRLKAWGLSRELSGDIITEQNIHTLDVMSWIMDEPPVYAVGTGGLTVRKKLGTCWDHFTLHFQYSNNVGITFSSRQFPAHGTQPEGIRNRMFGSRGVLETQYGGDVLIRGERAYEGGKTTAIYNEGIVNNIATFHRAITEGRFDNPTVEPSARSNMVTILGRLAAYHGSKVHWYQVTKYTERFEPDLSGLKA